MEKKLNRDQSMSVEVDISDPLERFDVARQFLPTQINFLDTTFHPFLIPRAGRGWKVSGIITEVI